MIYLHARPKVTELVGVLSLLISPIYDCPGTLAFPVKAVLAIHAFCGMMSALGLQFC